MGFVQASTQHVQQQCRQEDSGFLQSRCEALQHTRHPRARYYSYHTTPPHHSPVLSAFTHPCLPPAPGNVSRGCGSQELPQEERGSVRVGVEVPGEGDGAAGARFAADADERVGLGVEVVLERDDDGLEGGRPALLARPRLLPYVPAPERFIHTARPASLFCNLARIMSA